MLSFVTRCMKNFSKTLLGMLSYDIFVQTMLLTTVFGQNFAVA